jgi:hypothetical protein
MLCVVLGRGPLDVTQVGDVAQLVEHLVCNQGVVGSSPIVSTSSRSFSLRVVRSRKKKQANRLAFCAGHKLFDKLGWWNEIVEDLE